MKRHLLLITIILLNINVSLGQNPIVHLPALSPNGTQIAFNYQGDIWTANSNGENAKRLTVHEGYDTNPIWSADGQSIAFQSNRFGNNDVYIIPSNGGLSKRLTHHSANDILTDYTKNGDILFATRRDFAQVEREYEVHLVSDKGGTPMRFMDALGFDFKVSPNGHFVVFVKGSCRLEREAYRGSANRDLWLYNIKNDTYTQLTTFNGNDFYPQWGDNNTIYFQSSRSGKYNVHKLKISETGEKQDQIEQVSAFKDMGLFSFNVSRNGQAIILAKADKIFIINTATNSQKEVNINIAADYRFDPIERKTYTSNINDIAISPNGAYTALNLRGEIFLRGNSKDENRTVNVSKSPYRDRMASWINDSTLIFISDRDGQNNIYTLRSGDNKESNLFKTLKHKIERITKTNEGESNLVIAPNGKQMAFIRGRGKLIVATISNTGKIENEKTLLDGWDTPSGVSWSPDSKWLAYSLKDLDFNSEIYIHKADNTLDPVNISMHPKQDYGPIWSNDGKKLMFSSNRNNSDYDVWFTWLNKADWEKTPEDWKEEDKEADKSKNKNGKDKSSNGNQEKKEEIKDVIIDFEAIHERQIQVTSFTGGEFAQAFSKDGKTIYYTTGNGTRGDADTESDLFKISWDGKDRKAITKANKRPSNIVVDKKYQNLFMTQGTGSLSKIILASDNIESLPISARLNVNYHEESNQIFEEAWKAINDGFYDPNFHGQDWNVLKEIYKPLAMRASTRIDFQNMFNWMLGQVNASHMGFRSREFREDLQRQRTGLLGLEFVPNTNGSLRVETVVGNMPSDRISSKIQVGDVITAVNGTKLTKNLNVYSVLEGTANEKIYLDLKRGNNSIEVVIRPKISNRLENYTAWVKARKQLTEKYSNGQLGYIHIQGMNWTSFERFERELTAAGLGKKGLVIDVRFNGGGWTTDYLMAVLNVKQHAYTIPRGASNNLNIGHDKFKNHYPFSERLPLASWTKPSIALCNHTSYSNAKIFSHAYKALGLGTLVGEPTFGAVISTGSARLIDGSSVRMPFRGWFVKETGDNMDFVPAVPDIFVLNNPDDKAKNKDTQLKRAVDELLKQI